MVTRRSGLSPSVRETRVINRSQGIESKGRGTFNLSMSRGKKKRAPDSRVFRSNVKLDPSQVTDLRRFKGDASGRKNRPLMSGRGVDHGTNTGAPPISGPKPTPSRGTIPGPVPVKASKPKKTYTKPKPGPGQKRRAS